MLDIDLQHGEGAAAASAKPLSPQAWEDALAHHYLSSDGPWGSVPLTFLDATPEQLALAVGRDASEAEATVQEFLRLFWSQSSLRAALGRGEAHALPAAQGPGWFRFPVLTCVIAAAPSSLTDATDYRDRLRSLLKLQTFTSTLKGIATLWLRLEAWSQAARARGEAVRSVQLPDPGWMRQIGHAQAIAFPSRRDQDRLLALLRQRGPDRFRTAASLVREIRTHLNMGWSQGFTTAFFDFERRYRRGDRLLGDHPFNRSLIRLANDLLEQRGEVGDPSTIKLLISLDGDLLFQIAPGGTGGEVTPKTLGELAEATGSSPRVRDEGLRLLATGLRRGLLIFAESGWGEWLLSEDASIGGSSFWHEIN